LVWPDLPGFKATYSHRFFHLLPGKPVTVQVYPEKSLMLATFKKKLHVQSLIDTWK
jgi:hypothetical protein